MSPSFSLSQGQTSQDFMKNLSYFFKTPKEKIRPDRKTLKYETRELEHLPLLMKLEKHLTPQGLTEIIDIAYTMNLDNNSFTRRDRPKECYLQILADKSK